MQLNSTTSPDEQVLRVGHLDPQGDGHGGQEGPQVTTNLTGPYQCASLSAECLMFYLTMVQACWQICFARRFSDACLAFIVDHGLLIASQN